MINRLSRLPGVVVAPLSSVMRFAATDVDPLEAGRKLGVEAVVDGRLHVHEDRVRLTARLLAVDDGASLWANNFTEPLGELLAVQDTLAMQLVNALTAELSNEARSGVLAQDTTDVEAWQLYANGRYQLERRDASSLRRAIEFFDAALRRDPRFALASAGLSDAHALTAVFDVEPPTKAFGQARQAALRALELDPRLPAAHVALGHVVTQYDRDLEAGRTIYLQALKLQAGIRAGDGTHGAEPDSGRRTSQAPASTSARRRRSSRPTLRSWRFQDGSAISRARSTMPNGSCRALSRRRRRPRCRGSSSRT